MALPIIQNEKGSFSTPLVLRSIYFYNRAVVIRNYLKEKKTYTIVQHTLVAVIYEEVFPTISLARSLWIGILIY